MQNSMNYAVHIQICQLTSD